jgi:hypothetical protein
MANYFLNHYKSNQHGNTAASNIVIPDLDSDHDSRVPSDYYTVDKYAAAVLVGLSVICDKLDVSQAALV